jgi:hypothetical protein
MTRGARHRAALGLTLGSALAGYIVWASATEGRCGLETFLGEWTATDRPDERLVVAAGEVMVTAGPATTRLVLRPERDIGERGTNEVASEMPQVMTVYPTALGGTAARLCVLRVATPGGSLALLRTEAGLLRLEEAQSDPPVMQRLHRDENSPRARPASDYSKPPR